MALLDNIEIEVQGTLTRGISSVALEEGKLTVTLTDGSVHSLGSLLPEASDVFDKDSSLIPSMKSVAEYVEEMLTVGTEELI